MSLIRFYLCDFFTWLSDQCIGAARICADKVEYNDYCGTEEKHGDDVIVQVCDYHIGKYKLGTIISTWRMKFWADKLGYKK
jgi:hypothetical protein